MKNTPCFDDSTEFRRRCRTVRGLAWTTICAGVVALPLEGVLAVSLVRLLSVHPVLQETQRFVVMSALSIVALGMAIVLICAGVQLFRHRVKARLVIMIFSLIVAIVCLIQSAYSAPVLMLLLPRPITVHLMLGLGLYRGLLRLVSITVVIVFVGLVGTGSRPMTCPPSS